MSEENEYINLSYVPKDKRDNLRTLLFDYVQRQKNFNRLDAIVTNECSKRCFNNIKSDKIGSDETICLTSCFQRYYDSLEVGENVFDKLSSGTVDMTPLINGNFSDVVNKL